MIKLRVHVIQTMLCLIILLTLSTGCVPQSVPTDVATAQYPAEISGHVRIPNVLKSDQGLFNTTRSAFTFWIVDITFTNKGYADPEVISIFLFKLVAGSKIYSLTEAVMPGENSLLSLPVSHTGETVSCFRVPANLNPSDAWLKYESHGAVSYGRLTGGEKIPGYDWEKRSTASSDFID